MDKQEPITEQLTLLQAIDNYKNLMVDGKNAHAILYTPQYCHLVLLNKEGKFFNENGEFVPENVFEARIFNEKAELRWLNESGGIGKMVIIKDDSFPDSIGKIDQQYLFWGKSTTKTNGEWTEFATARIGSFFIPIKLKESETYARFTAIEYLKQYDDGNVAVEDERLTGINGYTGE